MITPFSSQKTFICVYISLKSIQIVGGNLISFFSYFRTSDTGNDVEDEPKADKQLDQQLFSLRKTLVSLSRKLYNTVNGDNKWQDLKKFPDLQVFV